MITTRAVAVFCAALLAAQNPYTFAQQPQPAAGAPDQSQKTLSQGQLESLVAPIALYPDPILSQALVASTYPLEIVEAGRWLSQHSNLTGKALADAAAKQPWDASVQALVMLPDVLKRLNQDVAWTSDLGNAFLAQQQDVMSAIQNLRQRAADAGALKSTNQQTVSTTPGSNNQPYIVIQPANPEVVYIPQYNPVAVWGPPPPYYPYPPIYYPPVSGGAIVAASAISFGAGVALGAIWGGGGWGGWGWGFGWGHGNNVVINNNFIQRNNFNRVNVGNGNNWVHNPAHRAGVPYNNRNVANRFGGNGTRPATRPSVGQTQQKLNNLGQRGAGQPGQAGPGGRGGAIPSQGNASRIGPGNAGRGAPGMGQPGQAKPAARPGGMPAQGGANRVTPGAIGQGGANRIGNRSLPATGGHGAFGGMGQGGRVQMNSNRGFASRGGGGGFRGGGGGFRGGGARGGGRRR